MSTEIEKFISTVDGKKLVSVDGENLIKQAFQRKQKTANVNVDAKDDGKMFTVGGNAGNTVDGIPYASQERENTLVATFQTAIDALTSQLEVKDQQLAAKDRQLEEKDKQLERQTKTIEELATSLAVAQHTAQAAQALHAGTIQRQIEDVPIIQAEELKAVKETAEKIMPEYEKRRSIFSRIFGVR
ncbi:MAG: hypothetical protein HFE61_12360 [Anaerotignum sp.]|nr:hypothetical protein [Anaerotignum sp.]